MSVYYMNNQFHAKGNTPNQIAGKRYIFDSLISQRALRSFTHRNFVGSVHTFDKTHMYTEKIQFTRVTFHSAPLESVTL